MVERRAAQRAVLQANIKELQTKIAAERLKVQAIQLRYQTDDDIKHQEVQEQVGRPPPALPLPCLWECNNSLLFLFRCVVLM